MTILQSIILGFVEGISEFLPISSTGHLILTATVLHIPQTVFTKSFEIIIQLGAILAVVYLYWRTLFQSAVLKKLIVAFLPTGVIGLSLYKIVKEYLFGNQNVVLWALFLGGITLIVFEYARKNVPEQNAVSIDMLTYRQALLIGLFQSVAIIPGVSRSAATIVGGLSLGLSRKTIVEFSFLLAVPTLMAASGLDIIKNYHTFSSDNFLVLSVGFVVAFFVALCSIKFLLRFVEKNTFTVFGVYRISIALAYWLLVMQV